MPLKNDSFPSSAAFDAINETLQADQAEKKNAINSAKAIVSFNLKNKDGEEKSWYLDLKNKGEVGEGAAPQGAKADVTLSLSDTDFAQLVSGKANAQRLFMGGKLKIKGNIMKATKMEPILKKAQGKAKL
ncbi:SCP2 sterol-binding domain-containing protein [Penicillium sp. IBT 18751x]|uniref:SCP2 sterol-binding domain-containing protein n=1 Tax=Penicillium maclennaniae TaxID=1343394 RepID=UPI00253F90F5|nr:SCP2 sterol-binding domain-containing protein [Penicillium maclennaniae]KAJ5662534.1 SCP2 sterol-binding domain-containing protein [Penicillium maclennaniae]KAJ6126617.1 SCP2 sterol-binding domain-containing protein [Penicillium sp. IBT 18751x]